MLIEMRTYSLAVGRTGDFLAAYEKLGLEPQWQILGRPLGYYVGETGELNQVVHIWQYVDASDRADRRGRLIGDPRWGAFLKTAGALVVKQESRLLSDAGFATRLTEDTGPG